jgi:hypothetical protein
MDVQLRSFFAGSRSDATPEEIKKNAWAELEIELD